MAYENELVEPVYLVSTSKSDIKLFAYEIIGLVSVIPHNPLPPRLCYQVLNCANEIMYIAAVHVGNGDFKIVSESELTLLKLSNEAN
jgi:hypothetical protein